MDIQFEEIFLYSKEPEKIYHFLSFLLDVEAFEYYSHKISFKFNNLTFVILPTEKKRIDKVEHFSLSVESLEELENLQKNIDFYFYKEGVANFYCDLKHGKLEFTDPDGRKWLVKLRNNASVHLQHKINNDLHVRNC